MSVKQITVAGNKYTAINSGLTTEVLLHGGAYAVMVSYNHTTITEDMEGDNVSIHSVDEPMKVKDAVVWALDHISKQ